MKFWTAPPPNGQLGGFSTGHERGSNRLAEICRASAVSMLPANGAGWTPGEFLDEESNALNGAQLRAPEAARSIKPVSIEGFRAQLEMASLEGRYWTPQDGRSGARGE